MAKRLIARWPLAVFVAGSVAVLAWNPFRSHTLGCPLFLTTGVLCPGCGSTRAMYELLHLRVGSAFRYNAFAVVAIASLLVLTIVRTNETTLSDRMSRLPAKAIAAFGMAVLAFGVLRNFPAFSFMAPPSA